MANQITAWSFSRWKDYEQCPRKAKYKHVDKIKEPGSDAMQRGSDIHLLAETFLKLPPQSKKKPAKELQLFSREFIELKKLKPMVEQDWALTFEWNPTGWFDKDAWLRVKMDAAAAIKDKIRVIDFKTGKPKDDHGLQLELYAIAGFSLFKNVEIVSAELWYLDSGTTSAIEVRRTEEATLKKVWMTRISPMLKDSRFAPKPGNYCRWCFFSKDKGGPCEF